MRPLFRCLFFSCFFLHSALLLAQILPEERATNWQSVGNRHTFSPTAKLIMAEKWGFVGDGKRLNDVAWARLMRAYPQKALIIQFSAGVFCFKKTIRCKSNVMIVGVSPQETQFRLLGEDDGILVEGAAPIPPLLLQENAYKGTHQLSVDNTKGIKSGDFLRIFSDDTQWITSEWAKNSVGQIVEVEKVTPHLIFIKVPLRMDYALTNNSRVEKLQMIHNVAIKSIKIVHCRPSHTKGGNIRFRYAANCWVENIESEKCNYAHLVADFSTQLSVRNSFFHHAHTYGNGGKGYGVSLQFTTNECLVENNVFEKLRHSMLVQAGANANVFAYNYSLSPYWTEVKLPKNAAGDIVLHGNYPYLNLFEGNIVQSIVIDKSHGINGPFNTFFRNRVELYGIFMSGKCDAQNFIANEIPNKKVFYGLFLLQGKQHFVAGNIVRGKAQTPPQNQKENAFFPTWSLYYQFLPEFLKKYENLARSIPAKDRWTDRKENQAQN